MNWDDFRIEFDEDGTLHVRGWKGWREPNCAVCGEPIRYCLDMFSFTTGADDHALAHAECVWTLDAFQFAASRLRWFEQNYARGATSDTGETS